MKYSGIKVPVRLCNVLNGKLLVFSAQNIITPIIIFGGYLRFCLSLLVTSCSASLEHCPHNGLFLVGITIYRIIDDD